MRTKARSVIHLHGGECVKVSIPLDELAGMLTAMVQSKPGSLFGFERVTDHGTLKRIFVPIGLITHIEDA